MKKSENRVELLSEKYCEIDPGDIIIEKATNGVVSMDLIFSTLKKKFVDLSSAIEKIKIERESVFNRLANNQHEVMESILKSLPIKELTEIDTNLPNKIKELINKELEKSLFKKTEDADLLDAYDWLIKAGGIKLSGLIAVEQSSKLPNGTVREFLPNEIYAFVNKCGSAGIKYTIFKYKDSSKFYIAKNEALCLEDDNIIEVYVDTSGYCEVKEKTKAVDLFFPKDFVGCPERVVLHISKLSSKFSSLLNYCNNDERIDVKNWLQKDKYFTDKINCLKYLHQPSSESLIVESTRRSTIESYITSITFPENSILNGVARTSKDPNSEVYFTIKREGNIAKLSIAKYNIRSKVFEHVLIDYKLKVEMDYLVLKRIRIRTNITDLLTYDYKTYYGTSQF